MGQRSCSASATAAARRKAPRKREEQHPEQEPVAPGGAEAAEGLAVEGPDAGQQQRHQGGGSPARLEDVEAVGLGPHRGQHAQVVRGDQLTVADDLLAPLDLDDRVLHPRRGEGPPPLGLGDVGGEVRPERALGDAQGGAADEPGRVGEQVPRQARPAVHLGARLADVEHRGGDHRARMLRAVVQIAKGEEAPRPGRGPPAPPPPEPRSRGRAPRARRAPPRWRRAHPPAPSSPRRPRRTGAARIPGGPGPAPRRPPSRSGASRERAWPARRAGRARPGAPSKASCTERWTSGTTAGLKSNTGRMPARASCRRRSVSAASGRS